MKDQRNPEAIDAKRTRMIPVLVDSSACWESGLFTIITTEPLMTNTIATSRQLNFSSLNKSPNNNTNVRDDVFNIVYKLSEMNLNETFESPISPLDANEQGNICFI